MRRSLLLVRVSLVLSPLTLLACSSGGSDGDVSGASANPAQAPRSQLPHACRLEPRPAWTWAASASSVLRLLVGLQAPLPCEIVSTLVAPGCCEEPEPCSPLPGNAFTTQQALLLFGDLESVISPPLAFDTLRAEIDAGRPVMPVFGNSFEGHVVVVYGYDAETRELYLCDPSFGDVIVPYDLQFTYSGTPLSWAATILRIQ